MSDCEWEDGDNVRQIMPAPAGYAAVFVNEHDGVTYSRPIICLAVVQYEKVMLMRPHKWRSIEYRVMGGDGGFVNPETEEDFLFIKIPGEVYEPEWIDRQVTYKLKDLARAKKRREEEWAREDEAAKKAASEKAERDAASKKAIDEWNEKHRKALAEREAAGLPPTGLASLIANMTDTQQ